MLRVFGQLMVLPVVAFVYGVEMLIKTMEEIRQISNQGVGIVVGSPVGTSDVQPSGLPEVRAAPAAVEQDSISNIIAAPVTGGTTQSTSKEEKPLSTNGDQTVRDKDLHDDMLKLVRYKVLFVRREYECAFQEEEDLVSENMDSSAFTAWKIAEFIQDLQEEPIRVPSKWRDKNYPPKDPRYIDDSGHLKGIPDEDKKYLRVYFEVLDRYPREKFKYEEQQIKVLEDIRDRLGSSGGATSTEATEPVPAGKKTK